MQSGRSVLPPQSLPMMSAPPQGFISNMLSQVPLRRTGREKTGGDRQEVVLFSGVPVIGGREAVLFDSTQMPGKLPGEGTIRGLRVRFPEGAPPREELDREVMILLYVGDLAEPRARVRLIDLVRQGERPLNLYRAAEQVVRVVLYDPAGMLADRPPRLEVMVYG
jgi:Ca-activated chloride channel homolog